MKMQIDSAQVHIPTKRDWNHRPNSGPISISSKRPERSVSTAFMSMEVSEMINPEALETTLCARSNTPMTIFQVLVTMRTAAADLNAHLKNIQLSTSPRLFFSVIS